MGGPSDREKRSRTRDPLTVAPDALGPEQKARIRAWASAHAAPVVPWLGKHWAQCRDWHLSRGVRRACWEATFRNWLRKAMEIEYGGAPSRSAREGSRFQADLEELREALEDQLPANVVPLRKGGSSRS